MGIHDGHRGRLRERYIREGGKHFAAHNLLELLLFYGIPRKDTNEIAHLLLKKFGDVRGVLSASVEELCGVPGISESAATLIRLTGELGTRFCKGETKDLIRFYTYDDMGRFFVEEYRGSTKETVTALLLDSKGCLLKKTVLCQGNVNSVALSAKDVIAAAIGVNAPCVVLAHNHPDGTSFPSSDDLATTRNLVRALSLSGIELVEHYVVAGNSYRRIMEDLPPEAETGLLRQRFALRMGTAVGGDEE